MYWAYRREGKFEAAAQAMRGAAPYWRPDQGMSALIAQLPSAYARGGKEGFLRQSLEMHKHFRDASLYLARDYADLGDKERALQELERAYNNRDSALFWILIDAELDPLRSEPRYKNLAVKIESGKS